MRVLNKSFCLLLVSGVLASAPIASAQNVPRLYTNDASCGAVKAAIRKNSKIVLRYLKPRGSRITYDLFFKSPSACTNNEQAVSASVPSSGGACKVSFRCVPRTDQNDESSNEPPVIVRPVVVTPPSDDDGCGGCESR